MKSNVYDVTLYWHDGGSVFLGTVSAILAAEAEERALQQYTAKNRVQQQEIEDGGSYQLSAELLMPDEAAAWRLKHKS